MTAHACPPDVSAKLAAGVVRTPALERSLEWLESTAKVLVLIGGTGSGKSVAAGWLHEYHRARPLYSDAGNRRGPAWYAAKVLGAVDVRDRETWREFDAATLITIDDVGTERWADNVGSAIERVWDVTSARLVLTTNLRRDELSPDDPSTQTSRFGARVASRLWSAIFVELDSPDYRTGAPKGDRWPSPRADTERERAAKEATSRAEAEADAEWEAGRAAREEAYAKQWAELREHLSRLEAAKVYDRGAAARADDEARRRLREQLRQRGGEP